MRKYGICLLTAVATLLAGCGGGSGTASTSSSSSSVFSRMTNSSATSASTGALSGTVTDSSGQVVAGASVTLTVGATSRQSASAGFTVTTDASGRWSIGNVAAGQYTVTASYEGTAEITSTVTVQAGQVADLGHLQCHAQNGGTTGQAHFGASPVADAGPIVGSVTDSSGTAIAGARVSINGAWFAMTGALGKFALGPLPAGNFLVDCGAPGYASAQQSATVQAGEATTLNFTLAAGTGTTTAATATVSGTVVDQSTGTALAGVALTLGSGRATTTSDSTGAFSFTDVTPGGAVLDATLSGYAPFEVGLFVPPGGTVTVAIKMVVASTSTATGSLALAVTDASTGNAIKGAVVKLNRNGPFYTDDSGNLSITGIPAGQYNITIGARGYVKVYDVLTVTDGGTTTLGYALQAQTQALNAGGDIEAGPHMGDSGQGHQNGSGGNTSGS